MTTEKNEQPPILEALRAAFEKRYSSLKSRFRDFQGVERSSKGDSKDLKQSQEQLAENFLPTLLKTYDRFKSEVHLSEEDAVKGYKLRVDVDGPAFRN